MTGEQLIAAPQQVLVMLYDRLVRDLVTAELQKSAPADR